MRRQTANAGHPRDPCMAPPHSAGRRELAFVCHGLALSRMIPRASFGKTLPGELTLKPEASPEKEVETLRRTRQLRKQVDCAQTQTTCDIHVMGAWGGGDAWHTLRSPQPPLLGALAK